MGSSSLNPIDAATGHFRPGVKTVLMVLSIVFGAGIAYAAFATKDDIVSAVRAHTGDEYPHTKQFEGVKAKLQAVKDVSTAAKNEASGAKQASQQTDRRVYALDAKIDFLIKNEVEKARESPEARQRTRRVARSVRARVAADTNSELVSETNDDPLDGLGL